MVFRPFVPAPRTRRLVVGGVLLALPALLVLLAVGRARLVAPQPTILLQDREGRFLAEVPDGGAELGYWSLDTLPPRVVAATLALEDHRFWRHPGVDPVAVLRALVQNLRSGHRVSGASTIAMQVARMQNPGRRTLARKAVEALTALFLTATHSRQAILAHYLRLAPYGNRIHGIAYAARRYLDKPVADLSWAEIAFLSALPQAPARMNPYTVEGHARAVARAHRILAELRAHDVLGAADFELAAAQLDALRMPSRAARPVVALHAILRLQRMLTDPALGRTLPDQPLVTTTLDLALQARVAGATGRAVESWFGADAGNAAVVVVDRARHEVLAAVGSADFFDRGRAGAYDYTALRRSPGSTLKPFLYALALERGDITPATVLDDVRRAAGGIADADGEFLGPLLPRVALANSRNIPAANLLGRVGLEVGWDFLREVGLHDGSLPARRMGLGMVVGGLPVSLERLVRAYTVLADDGRLSDLVWVRGRQPAPARRLLSEAVAREVTVFLADPMARLPSFPRMGATEYPFPVAVKTGTSPGERDAWTVAYSNRYLVGVWVGRADARPVAELTGYTSAALLTRKIMLGLHEKDTTGLRDLSFPPPDGFVAVRLCALTGLRASPSCDRAVDEFLPSSQVPMASCRAHVRLTVDTRNGLLASRWTPPAFLADRSFVELGTAEAAWAAARGLAPPREVSPLDLPRAPLGRVIGERPARLRVTSPEAGARLMRDPDTPPTLATVALQAVADPAANQLLWVVDGRPYAVVDYPSPARWPLAPGEHTFQARVPYTDIASAPVHVTVR
jgi:penicillin-binding protein 1C